MKRLLDHHGITLIEIVITLFIASVIMVMSGSILLFSMGFFDQHAISDFDKSSLDSAFQGVSDQLKYASAITISTMPLTKSGDDDWSYYHIENGRLYYRASRKEAAHDLYPDLFYHQRKMIMQVQKQDRDKLYLYMGLQESDRTVYERQLTISLPTISVHLDNGTSAGITAPDNKIYTDAYVYFQHLEDAGSGDIPDDVTGTVADEKYCLEDHKDAYKEEFKVPARYEKGDFVTYQGILYRAQKKVNAFDSEYTPDVRNTGWKRIDANWNITSEYQKGDIIIYQADEQGNNIYYKSLVNHNVGWHPDAAIGHAWVKLDPSEVPKDHECRVTWN